LTFKIKE